MECPTRCSGGLMISSLEVLCVICVTCSVSKRKPTSSVEEALGVTCVATTGLWKLLLLLFSSGAGRALGSRAATLECALYGMVWYGRFGQDTRRYGVV